MRVCKLGSLIVLNLLFSRDVQASFGEPFLTQFHNSNQDTMIPPVHHHRNLQVIYSATQSSSCKKCIDDNNFFCQNATGSAGKCCQSSEVCDEIDVCSYHAPQESVGLKYWACPHSLLVCGVENLFMPSDDGAASSIRPRSGYKSEFTQSSMCRYRLIFP